MRVADVLQDVGAQQAVLAGEAVDFDFGHRGAVGEIVERLAAARLADRSECPACGRSPGRRAGTRCVRGFAHLAERAPDASPHDAGHRRSARRRVAVQQRRRDRSQPRANLRARIRTAAPFRSVPAEAAVADVFGTLSVRVGITRTAIGAHAQAVGGDLLDLRVQSLPHLGAAVIHLHAAVAIDQHERAGLVEERRRERDAELHRRDGEAALGVWMLAR